MAMLRGANSSVKSKLPKPSIRESSSAATTMTRSEHVTSMKVRQSDGKAAGLLPLSSSPAKR